MGMWSTHIVISMWKVCFCVVFHQKGLIITDQRVPVMTETKLLIGAS